MRKAETYLHRINVPEGRSGPVSVTHVTYKAGHVFMTASARTAMLGGDKGPNIIYNRDVVFRQLAEDGRGVWMSDVPIEQHQHETELRPVRGGSVLIGGLGLGVAVAILSKRTRIKRIVVVEKSRDVMNLVAPHLSYRPGVEVVNADLFDYLKAAKPGTFDYAFYDIWQGDGESTFFQTVCPLLKLSKDVVRRRPICWNENVMRGQLYWSIWNGLQFSSLPEQERDRMNFPTLTELATPKGNFWHDWKVPLFKRILDTKPPLEVQQRMAIRYAGTYGLPGMAEGRSK